MIEWNLQTRAHACQDCGQAFTDRQPYHTLLFDDRQGYRRFDVCEACWKAQHSEAASHRKGFISHWQGLFLVPPPPGSEPIQKDTAESLLRKLLERNDPQHAPASFILAVMLERKRVLKVKAQTVSDGRRLFVYEHAKTGDAFTIPDPELQLNELDAVQRDVAHLLEHGLDAPVAAPSAPLSDVAPSAPSAVPEPAAEVPGLEGPAETEAETAPEVEADAAGAEPAAAVEPAAAADTSEGAPEPRASVGAAGGG